MTGSVMQEYFELRPSPTQQVLLLVGHGLLAFALGLYVEPASIKLPAIALTLLLGLRERYRLAGEGELVLHCDPRSARIALQRAGQPYFYCKYKVYATRWFAILKLVENGNYRTLVLNSDRFESASSYHRLRFLLRRLERSRAA